MVNPDIMYMFFKYAGEHQLRFVSPFAKFLVENIDVHISIFCDSNPKHLSSVNLDKISTYASARRELTDIFFKRVAEKSLRWVVLPYPANPQAQEASMSLEEYEDFIYHSCFVDKEDPIYEWKRVDEEQRRICNYLDNVSIIRFVGENTDLVLNVRNRKWINCSGKDNMPDGEVFTCPIEDSANGTIRFTYPGIYMGQEVGDVLLEFNGGKVVKARAAEGEELLQRLLSLEGADRIGEIAIGTNYGIKRFTKNMLFDEKMGGAIHLALGASYPESGGINRSSIHWDILKDMTKCGEIYADNVLFYKNGRFLI